MGKRRGRRKKKAEAPESAVVKEAEKLAEAVKAAKKASPKRRKSSGKKKKASKSRAPAPKRGFRVTKSVLEVLRAVKKYGKQRFEPEDIYKATGRDLYVKRKGRVVQTKAFKKWKELFQKLERAGYIVRTRTGYYITPAAGRLLKSRTARMSNTKGIRPRRVRKKRGRTEKPASMFKAWGVSMVDERRDKHFSALPPGKRISKSGRVYYEYRPNRSDLNPRKGL